MFLARARSRALLLPSLLVASCGVESNSPPEISAIVVSPEPVVTSASLSCTATDPDDDALTYAWLVGGIEVSTGNPGAWTSPGIPGVYEARVVVSDGKASASIARRVDIGSESPWPRFGQGLQSTGRSAVSTSSNLGSPSKVLEDVWGVSSPAIGADGTVYIGANKQLAALGADHSVKWRSPQLAQYNLESSPALAADGTVYVAGSDPADHYQGRLYALRSTDGSIKWSFAASGPINSAPAIAADGTVYVAGSGGWFYAVTPSGAQKWAFQSEADHYQSSPALAPDGTIYVGTSTCRSGTPYCTSLLALNPDGTLKWSYKVGAQVRTSPAVGADGTVYFGAHDGRLYALTPEGELKWSYLTADGGAEMWSSPALGADGVIYVGTYAASKHLFAVNPDGTLKWSFETEVGIKSAPVIGGDGTIFFGQTTHTNFYALEPNGTVRWSLSLGSTDSSAAIAANGKLYLKTDRDVFVIQ